MELFLYGGGFDPLLDLQSPRTGHANIAFFSQDKPLVGTILTSANQRWITRLASSCSGETVVKVGKHQRRRREIRQTECLRL